MTLSRSQVITNEQDVQSNITEEVTPHADGDPDVELRGGGDFVFLLRFIFTQNKGGGRPPRPLP